MPHRRGHRRNIGNNNNNGGNRSTHFHEYPGGPWGPSGEPYNPLGWGHDGQVYHQWPDAFTAHVGQYAPWGEVTLPDNPNIHTGINHSSTTHTHPQKKFRRRRSIPANGGSSGGDLYGCQPNQDGVRTCRCAGGSCLPGCCTGSQTEDKRHVAFGYGGSTGMGGRQLGAYGEIMTDMNTPN